MACARGVHGVRAGCARRVHSVCTACSVHVHAVHGRCIVCMRAATPHLDAVRDLVGEVLERAHGDRLLGRVAARAVALGHLRHDELHVALGAERAGLEQRLLVVDAALVDVEACLHVVERVAHAGERLMRGVRAGWRGVKAGGCCGAEGAGWRRALRARGC